MRALKWAFRPRYDFIDLMLIFLAVEAILDGRFLLAVLTTLVGALVSVLLRPVLGVGPMDDGRPGGKK